MKKYSKQEKSLTCAIKDGKIETVETKCNNAPLSEVRYTYRITDKGAFYYGSNRTDQG